MAAPAPSSRLRSAPAPSFFERTGAVAVLLLLLALPLLFWQLGAYGLIDVDEGRYAEVPREMLVLGDWVTPRLNFILFFDKPPLLYWGIALAYKIGGTSEWMARSIPALAALLGIGAAYGLGRRMFGPRAGFLGAFVLCTSLLWLVLARVVLTDMLVSSLVFCALALWWLALSDASKKRRAGYLAAFWIALGLGMLAKGPVALVLCGGAIFVYLLLCRQWATLKIMGWSWGLPLLGLVAAPWFVAVALRNPEFNHDFWYAQNVARFLGSGVQRDHAHGPFYLFAFLPLIAFPWTLYAPAALLASGKKLWPARTQTARAAVFLLSAIALVMLFFSASESKLVTYIAPVVPPYAILMGAALARWIGAPASRNWLLTSAAALLALALTVGGLAAFIVAPRALEALGVGPGLSLLAATAILAWGLALFYALWKGQTSALIAATGGGFAVCFLVGTTLLPPIAREITTKPLIAQIHNGLRPETQIITVGFSQSLPFYTGKRMRVDGTPDELAPGKSHLSQSERARWFYEIAPDLRALMLAPAPTYCIVRLNNFQEEQVAYALRGAGNRVAEIARNKRFLIVANAAAAALTPPQTTGETHFARTLRQQSRPGALAPTPLSPGGLAGQS